MLTSGQVLIVDDDETVRLNLAAFLEDEGFDVLSAADGEQALELLQDSPNVAVAIVDVRLPRMDGNELILAAHERNPSLRFLVHTGSVDYTPPEALVRIGVREADILRKPVPDLRQVVDAVRSKM